jgi:hypothetical protein
MSDYVQIQTFTPKDSLFTGDPLKLIKGSEMDAELSSIETTMATKYDSTDIAIQAIAEAGTSNTTLLTPLRGTQLITAQLSASLGVAKSTLDFQLDFTNLPGQTGIDASVDTLTMYDDSTGLHVTATVDDFVMSASGDVAVSRQIISGAGLVGGGDLSADRTLDIGAGTGITVAADAISTDDAAIVLTALSGYDANEHIDHSLITITAGTGLTVSSGTGVIDASMTIDADSATATGVGVVELATEAEARAGTDTTRATTVEAVHGLFHSAFMAGGSAATFNESGDGSWSSSNPSTGTYTITHNYGSTDYNIWATVFQSSGNMPFTANVTAHGTTSFTVQVRDNADALTDSFSRVYFLTMNLF